MSRLGEPSRVSDRVIHGLVPAEAAGVTEPNPHEPGLGIGNAAPKLAARRHFDFVDFVGTAFDIDGNELSFVPGLEQRLNVAVVDRRSALGELFFRVSPSPCSHEILGAVLALRCNRISNG